MNGFSILNRLLPKKLPTPTPPSPPPLHKPLSPDTKAITNTILTHLESNNLTKAVSILFYAPFPFPPSLYTRLFQHCSSKLSIVEARKVESHLVTFSPTPPVFLLNRAIETYGKCRCIVDARELFDEMPERDGGSWNAMITAYSHGGYPEQALELFSQMNNSGVVPNQITFASVLRSCGAVLDVFLASQVHGFVVKFGLCWNVILGSSLVDVYGKCSLMADARRMFDELQNPNDVSWNVIVRRYFEVGDERESVVMFFKMIGTCVSPLNFTFSTALIACSRISALTEGKQIHGLALKVGLLEDEVVMDPLIDMYSKCGALEDACQLFGQSNVKNVVSWTSIMSGYAMCGRIQTARRLFDHMPERTLVSWNAMLAGYTQFHQWEEAMDFIFWMLKSTQEIDHVSLGLILNTCAGLLDVERGKQVHAFMYRHDFCLNAFVGNALLDMYGKCRSKNFKVWFSLMCCWRDKISWNALISSYARYRSSEEALEEFTEMLGETTPSEFTFGTVLAACANIFALKQGKQIHGYMLRNGHNFDVVVRAALVDMYSKCRSLDYAVKVFKNELSKDVILWNSMALGCAYNGKGVEVLKLFRLMEEEGVKADNITFQAVLRACIGEGFVELGKKYFCTISEHYCVIPRPEHYECMIELFTRYGCMDELEDFVCKMPFEPSVGMLRKVIDACRDHRFSKLGKWAAERMKKHSPLMPVRFEIQGEKYR